MKLIETVAKKLKLNISVQFSEWGILNASGFGTGVFQQLMEEVADIGIGSLTYMPRNEYVDFGPTYAFDDIICCVPKPPKSLSWTKVLDPYGPIGLILYLLTLILTSVSVFLLSKMEKNEPKYNQKIKNTIFRCAGDAFGNTYTIHRPKSSRVRIVYLLWLMLTLHMSALYSGNLFAMFTVYREDNKFSSIDDIINSSLRLQLYSPRLQFTIDSPFNNTAPYSSKFHYCPNLINCLKKLTVNGDSALCLTKTITKLDAIMSMPNRAFQASTALVGLGVVANILAICAMLLFFFCHSTTVFYVCAWMQLVSGIGMIAGCAIYPAGWSQEDVQKICGPQVDRYNFGDCGIRWAFLLAAIGCLDAIILTTLAFILATRHVTLQPEPHYAPASLYKGEMNSAYVSDSASVAGSRKSLNIHPVLLMPPGQDDTYSQFSQRTVPRSIHSGHYSHPHSLHRNFQL